MQEDPLKYPHISVAESVVKSYFKDPLAMLDNFHAHDYSGADWLHADNAEMMGGKNATLRYFKGLQLSSN